MCQTAEMTRIRQRKSRGNLNNDSKTNYNNRTWVIVVMLTRDLNQGPSSARPRPLMIHTELWESWTRPCRMASTSGVGVLLWLDGWVRVPS